VGNAKQNVMTLRGLRDPQTLEDMSLIPAALRTWWILGLQCRPHPTGHGRRVMRVAPSLLDLVHVAHGHREDPVRRTRAVIVLRLSAAHESIAVADDDEHAAAVNFPLARLLFSWFLSNFVL
jgi:hypothetical protein